MGKTPSYVKDAVKAYRDKNEFIQVRVDKGTKDVIKRLIGENGNISAYCNSAIMTAIEGDIDMLNGRDMTIYEAAEEDINEIQGKHRRTDQKPEIKPKSVKTDKSTKEPQKSEIKESVKAQKVEKTPEERNAELQALIAGKKAEQERIKAEKEAEKERQRQKSAEELQDYVRNLRQEQAEWKEKELAEDMSKFEQFDDGKIKAMLNDSEFRACVSNPVYKVDFVQNYGICNYERIQKCLREIEEAEKEDAREESISSARCQF